MESIVYLLAGLALGLVLFLGYFIRQRQAGLKNESTFSERLHHKEQENRSLAKEIELLKLGNVKSTETENDLRDKLLKSETEGARLTAHNSELERRLKEQTSEQIETARQMQEKFENLANRIFDQKSAKFSELNQEKIKTVLQPLDKDIREFRKKVEELHEKDAHRHVALREFVSVCSRHKTN